MHCAKELVPWKRDLRRLTACVQNSSIKRCIVSDKEVRFLYEIGQFWPHLAKSWAVTNIIPGQTVDVRKHKSLPWRSDKLIIFFGDTTMLYEDRADGARAVTVIVGRLKVDCNECRHDLLG